MERLIRLACTNAISCEPKLTEWDTIMGDGDCGETISAGCNGKTICKRMTLDPSMLIRLPLFAAVIASLDAGLAKGGSVLRVVEEVLKLTESKMGGTLGAIFGMSPSSPTLFLPY